MVPVKRAFVSDHFPYDGNISEEVLVLADGRAVYLFPGAPDELHDTLDTAKAHCVGVLEEFASLLVAWTDGYDTPSLVDLINTELQRFEGMYDDLDAWEVCNDERAEPHLVALADLQETTVCYALPVLRALEALPDTAGWEDVWQVVHPHIYQDAVGEH